MFYTNAKCAKNNQRPSRRFTGIERGKKEEGKDDKVKKEKRVQKSALLHFCIKKIACKFA